MKGLDTSVLLGLLEGDPAVRALLKKLRGVELATTEANLLELSYLAGRGSARARAARRDVLDRLRRKLTVLPIDSRAVDAVGKRLGKGGEKLPPLVLAALAALEAGGCDELFSREPVEDLGKWRFRFTRIGRIRTK